jgi:hypothetical protein
MRTVKFVLSAALVLAVVAYIGTADAKRDEKPKYTTKEVMKKAHKEPAKGEDSLRDKVVGGKASAEEKKLLLDLYTALAQNKPPQGDIDTWKKKNEAIIAAAKKDDLPALKKATACGDCHGEFRPKK